MTKCRGLLCIALLALCLSPTSAHAQSGEVVNVLHHAAYTHNVDVNLLYRIAWCESRFDPLAYNTRDGSAGLFQFQPSTFVWASENAGYGGYSVYDLVANAMAAGWLLSQPGGVFHWTCW